MNSEELIERARYSAYIAEGYHPEFDDARILAELNDRLRSVFSDAIVKSRSGYWLTTYVETITSGVVYVPPRAAAGGVEAVDYQRNGVYRPLEAVTPREADRYALATGRPRAYYVDAERIHVLPAPTPSAPQTIRVRYYLRPSLLAAAQSLPLPTVRGLIVSVNASARTATVNSVPTGAGGTLTTGAIVDVVRPAGWFSPVVVSEPATSIVGSVVTLGGMAEADFAATVRVGHFVRGEGLTDWAAVPEDFHRLVADAAAVKILMEMGLSEKAQELSSSATAEFNRFRDLINPRTKADPSTVRLRPYWTRGT